MLPPLDKKCLYCWSFFQRGAGHRRRSEQEKRQDSKEAQVLALLTRYEVIKFLKILLKTENYIYGIW